MVRTISKVAFVAVCVLALSVFTQRANATDTDFSCGSGTCTGTLVANAGNYSGSGINLLAETPFGLPIGDGPEEGGELFTLTFNTATGAISLNDAVGDGGIADAILTGKITSWSTFGGTGLSMSVTWSAPPNYVTPSGFVIIKGNGPLSNCTGKGCAVASADINVTPSPEPASLLLLGTGLLGMGAAVRRRLIG